MAQAANAPAAGAAEGAGAGAGEGSGGDALLPSLYLAEKGGSRVYASARFFRFLHTGTGAAGRARPTFLSNTGDARTGEALDELLASAGGEPVVALAMAAEHLAAKHPKVPPSTMIRRTLHTNSKRRPPQ